MSAGRYSVIIKTYEDDCRVFSICFMRTRAAPRLVFVSDGLPIRTVCKYHV